MNLINNTKKSLVFLTLLVCSSLAFAETSTAEINYLIDSVGRDGCGLVRNKRRFSTYAARHHLQSKWELNAHLVNNTADFINKIASVSVTSGEPYQIKCRGEEAQLASEWFGERLFQYRMAQQSG